MAGDIVISSAVRGTISALIKTQSLIDRTTLRLASGLKVNSALDNPQNFFTAQALDYRANDLQNLLDSIEQNIQAVKENIAGLEALNELIDEGEAVVTESKKKLELGETDPAVQAITTDVYGPNLNSLILASTPVVYYRLNDASSPATDSGFGGGVNAVYAGGVTLGAAPLYTNSPSASASFDGINDRVEINDSALINTGTYAQRTVELVFNANTTAGRQVIFEEGAATNGLSIYIDNGRLYITGEDDSAPGIWHDADIHTDIVAGQTYHVAFVFNQPTNSFTGYLDGVNIGSVTVANSIFPSHSGNVTIGRMGDGAQFHDGEASGNGFHYNGRISDVAIYNTALSAATIAQHAQSLEPGTYTHYINTQFQDVLDQINQIVQDAHYRGLNLLANENITTYFNENRTSFLVSEGRDFTSDGLGLINDGFNDINIVEDILDNLSKAKDALRNYGFTLANDLSIIQTRETFTRDLITTLRDGADDLVNADQNTEGANLLALQTRQSLGVTALSLITRSEAQVLNVVNSFA